MKKGKGVRNLFVYLPERDCIEGGIEKVPDTFKSPHLYCMP
jgi:hypothetical protein